MFQTNREVKHNGIKKKPTTSFWLMINMELKKTKQPIANRVHLGSIAYVSIVPPLIVGTFRSRYEHPKRGCGGGSVLLHHFICL